MSVIACLQIGEQKDCDLFKKRAILFMGISILPLLKFRGEAIAAGELGFLDYNYFFKCICVFHWFMIMQFNFRNYLIKGLCCVNLWIWCRGHGGFW